MNVLIADSNVLTIQRMLESLESVGVHGMIAKNARTILEMLRYSTFDGIFMELETPELDGIQVLHKIRKEHPQLSVIVMSRYWCTESIVYTLKLGANNFLTKPIQLDKLLPIIHELKKNRSLLREQQGQPNQDQQEEQIMFKINGESSVSVSNYIEEIERSMQDFHNLIPRPRLLDIPTQRLKYDSFPKGNVLVLEEDEKECKMITDCLEELNYRVIYANTMPEILYALTRFSTEFVIAGVAMSHISSCELLKHFSLHDIDTPVLFTSRYPASVLIRYDMLSPRTPFLQKPLTRESLIQAIDNMTLTGSAMGSSFDNN